MKICKFSKKIIDEEIFLAAKVKNVSNKILKQLKAACNEAVLQVLNPPQETT